MPILFFQVKVRVNSLVHKADAVIWSFTLRRIIVYEKFTPASLISLGDSHSLVIHYVCCPKGLIIASNNGRTMAAGQPELQRGHIVMSRTSTAGQATYA